MLNKLEQLDYVRSLSTSSPSIQALEPNSGTPLSLGELSDPLRTSSNFFRASSSTAPVSVGSSDNFASKNNTASTAFGGLPNLIVSSDPVPNQVIVKFKSGVNQASIQAIRSNIEASVVKRTQVTGAELWEIKGSDIANTIRQYSQDSRIEYIEPNYKINVTAIPNDPSFSSLWGLNNTGQGGGKPDADIDAAEAWNIQTGNNVLVGVIDTGVDYNHPDLAANIWTNPGEIAGDRIDNDGNGYVDDIHGYDFINNDSNPMDDVGHGTHVAGTIAASGNNGVGVTGVSWSSKIMALKFLGPNGGSTYDAIRALNYATQMGAKITNNSWAGGGFSQGLYDAIAAARNAGSLFIAAAGNAANNNDLRATYPANYDLDNIITVAATDRNDQLASFSNYGATTVDIGAPGVGILSTTPNNTYSTYDGTSMAAPHAAGVASLVWAQNPGMTYAQVKERILTSGDPITSLQGKTLTGRRLNAYNALTGKPTITISAIDASAAEPSDPGQFTISRAGSTDSALTVNYSLSGTATNNSDYNNLSGSVVIPVGSTTATINITPIDDTLVEGNETVVANLTSNSAYTIGNANSATVTIADNDNPAPSPSVTISATDANSAEVASGTANPGQFTISRSGDTSTALTVNYSLAGTATNGSDYNNLSGSVVIPVGSTTATIQVNVNNDTFLEADETVIATLTANAAYTLGTAQTATVNIFDDDKTRVSITATDANAAEVASGQPANPGQFTITRTGSTNTSMTVNYTLAGTATKSFDYSYLSGSVVIPLGATSVTLPINVLADILKEADETVIVTLTANSAYHLGTVNGTDKSAAVTILDND